MEATAANLDMESELDIDFTIDKKTGEVKQVGEANNQPDRVVKTNDKGEVKSVVIDNIEKGILKDGMNFKEDYNVIQVGGAGQPTEEGVQDFLVALSDEVAGAEITGYGLMQRGGGSETTTGILVEPYKDNKLDYSQGLRLDKYQVVAKLFTGGVSAAAKYHFHIHPNMM